MQLDFSRLRIPSMDRKPLFAGNGVVATGQPLASQAGLTALKRGGNAVDAALAAAITLTVVQPMSCGVGGDLFALVWDGTSLHGLNGSGRAPMALTLEEASRRGYDTLPAQGWLSVTVPGVPAAWSDLHRRFGKLPFADLFEAALSYAEQGYPVSPISVFHWRWAVEMLHSKLQGEEYQGFTPVFAPGGRSVEIGERWSSAELAQTLRLIAQTSADAFYRGELAQRIVDFSQRTQGLLTLQDLAEHTSTWMEPISTNYRGYDVWEMPPNGQGLAVLMALNILEGFELKLLPRESVQSYHLQLEAMKLAFVDAQHTITDPEHVAIPVEELLSKAYAARRREMIGEQALVPKPSERFEGGTVYLCTADADGMMVSLIQSCGGLFGSHVVVPGTGVALQNRASAFSLDPGHPNRLAPGKRPFHTIIPGFLSRNGQPIGPFGVKGGHMQPQGHLQVIVNTVDYQMDPQAALNAPRWFWGEDLYVQVEPTVSSTIVAGLAQRGHEVVVDDEIDFVGQGHIIWRLPSGIYIAGGEPRGDGSPIGY